MPIKRIEFVVDNHIIEVSKTGVFIFHNGVRNINTATCFDLHDLQRIVQIAEEQLDD